MDIDLVRKIGHLLDDQLEEALRQITGGGLTLAQYDVLRALLECDNWISMSELASRVGCSRGNITGLVERLVQNGKWVWREEDPEDRRVNRVRLNRISDFKLIDQRLQEVMTQRYRIPQSMYIFLDAFFMDVRRYSPTR